jgi:hypothetical protein
MSLISAPSETQRILVKMFRVLVEAKNANSAAFLAS